MMTRPAAARAVSLGQLEGAVRNVERISSFVLSQDGQIRSQFHRSGASIDRPVNIKSASKGVLNALTGIALARGDLKSLDEPISAYLPRYFAGFSPEDARREITVRHLVTMSSGLASTSIHNYGAWVNSSDWVAYVLNRELVNKPGERMMYSTGDTHLLAAVLTKASGAPLRTYAQRHLFDPLGVEIGGWDRDPQGVYFGGNNMALSAAALLRFGELYLNLGMYEGKQVLSREWIAASWTPRFLRSSFNERHDYGYLWWRGTFGGKLTWFAWGYGGQFLFVIPELDAVVVITGDPDAPSRGGNEAVYHLVNQTVVPYLTSQIRQSETASPYSSCRPHRERLCGPIPERAYRYGSGGTHP